jgi:carbonic anhydrase/acetyltransferase-like protein (isoleucine patch superfamily)
MGILPLIAPDVFIADNATVIGKVEVGEQSSIWYNVVLRGDADWIRIGKRTNVQDGAILHCSTGMGPTVIGDDVTIGHSAVVHGCTVHSTSLIGIGAVILDEAVVQSHVVVAAGSVVTPRTVLESGFLYGGVPARKIRPLSPEEVNSLTHSAEHYAENAQIYRAAHLGKN